MNCIMPYIEDKDSSFLTDPLSSELTDQSIFVSQFQILPESVELIARPGPQGEQPPLEQWKQATTSSPDKIFQVDSLFGS